jgi:hypothetical protein
MTRTDPWLEEAPALVAPEVTRVELPSIATSPPLPPPLPEPPRLKLKSPVAELPPPEAAMFGTAAR